MKERRVPWWEGRAVEKKYRIFFLFIFFKDERESKRGRCDLNLKRCEV